jgi:hypothetical protein
MEPIPVVILVLDVILIVLTVAMFLARPRLGG